MARLLEQIVGHHSQILKLKHAFTSDRFPSALLFVGPAGIGKKKVALAVAQLLVCEQKTACGCCPSCVRIEKMQSEALLFLEPQSGQIKIEQARQVLKFMNLRSGSVARVIIIDGAHSLNPQAANALLKSIEEPPEGTYFIMTAPSVSGVLPTIRSRSQMMRFGILTKNQLAQIFQTEEWILSSAQGSAGYVEDLQSDEIGPLRIQAINVWLDILKGQTSSAFETVKELVKDRNQSLHVARIWQQIIRDAWFQAEGVGPIIHQDFRGVITQIGQLGVERLGELAQGALHLEKEIAGNSDRSLSFQNYLYQSQHVIA